MEQNQRYKPKYFELYEVLPPELYKYEYYISEEAREKGWELMDEKLLITMDIIRGEIVKAPLICNTWYQDGNRRNSGLRVQNCTVGATNSQHKLGKAADLLCPKYTAEEMRQMIRDNEHLLPYPIRIEDGVSWLHIDTKERKKGPKIYFFKA